MKITVDTRSRSVYVYLHDGDEVAVDDTRTISTIPATVMADYDADDVLLGIEIVGPQTDPLRVEVVDGHPTEQ